MLPIVIFSILSFIQVSAELREQSMVRLQSEAKTLGLAIFERLSFLETNLDLLGSRTPLASGEKSEFLPIDVSNYKLQGHFKAIAFITNPLDTVLLVGSMNPIPKAITELAGSSNTSKTIVYFEPERQSGARVFLVKILPGVDGKHVLLVGEANTVYLWGTGSGNTLPPMTDLCMLDATRNVLFSSFIPPKSVLHQIHFESASMETRSLEYAANGEGMFIGYWPLFLNSQFEGPNLIVVLKKAQDDVFSPLSHFKILFPLIALLAFWIVLFLSTISIRKIMIPLEQLKEGALRLARRDFNTRMIITSGDEFETLADTFNVSATHLGRQFHAMEVMAEIDQAILSTLNVQKIVNTALKRMYDFFSCDAVSFGLAQARQIKTLQTFCFVSRYADEVHEEFLTISPEDMDVLHTPTDYFILDTQNGIPSFLPQTICQDISQLLLLPLYLNNTFTGIICLGHSEAHAFTEDDLAHLKRLSSQVAVALSNAHLVEELELLNWGTLEALARTVDAKSKWTAGHSERVAELSVKIARVMGCDDKMISTLHRAAFLHDIGKIGISRHILDKPGKLTDEEYDQIKEHSVIGAKIIEPIEAYADTLPIIIQHHERFDGKGYPFGLSGTAVTLGARILSVADVYDALISSRPYRQGWVEEKVIKLIADESGKQFDPKVVDAFFSAVSWSIEGILNK